MAFQCLTVTQILCACFLLGIALAAGTLNNQKNNEPHIPLVCYTICNSSVNIDDTPTAKFCANNTDLEMFGRCCINATLLEMKNQTAVLGIDLEQCDITENDFSSGIEEADSLLYISLEGNPINNITNIDFHNNTEIIRLSIPSNLKCPGREETWQKIMFTENATICLRETNPCEVYNFTCPENSHCVHTGVDLLECLCDEDYHGYKCLEKGTFPVVTFAIGLTVPTVIICILLWVTQRRYVLSAKNK